MNLIKLLSRPIAFQRPFVAVSGSITGALFLSQLHYWTPRGKTGGGWVYKTRDEWTEETGMTRAEQETARKKLIKNGLMEEKLCGVPATLHYRINAAALNSALKKLCSDSEKKGANPSWRESSQLAGGNLTNKKAGKQPTTTESTTETTFREKVKGAQVRVVGVFKPRFSYPVTEGEMIATLEEHGVQYDIDYDGSFFDQMEASGWTIQGKPVFDWVATYAARLQVTSPV